MQVKLTVDDLKKMDKPFIGPEEAAAVIGCTSMAIRVSAQQQVETGKQYLGFPFSRMGTRTFIPRVPFIRYVEGGAAQ